jgi:hypothetical protein
MFQSFHQAFYEQQMNNILTSIPIKCFTLPKLLSGTTQLHLLVISHHERRRKRDLYLANRQIRLLDFETLWNRSVHNHWTNFQRKNQNKIVRCDPLHVDFELSSLRCRLQLEVKLLTQTNKHFLDRQRSLFD